uniref:Uncharacterized protein n=1 Tax=Arundo donax TaxID=35708 RepID=A0A0A9EW70_ARUDO
MPLACSGTSVAWILVGGASFSVGRFLLYWSSLLLSASSVVQHPALLQCCLGCLLPFRLLQCLFSCCFLAYASF